MISKIPKTKILRFDTLSHILYMLYKYYLFQILILNLLQHFGKFCICAINLVNRILSLNPGSGINFQFGILEAQCYQKYQKPKILRFNTLIQFLSLLYK